MDIPRNSIAITISSRSLENVYSPSPCSTCLRIFPDYDETVPLLPTSIYVCLCIHFDPMTISGHSPLAPGTIVSESALKMRDGNRPFNARQIANTPFTAGIIRRMPSLFAFISPAHHRTSLPRRRRRRLHHADPQGAPRCSGRTAAPGPSSQAHPPTRTRAQDIRARRSHLSRMRLYAGPGGTPHPHLVSGSPLSHYIHLLITDAIPPHPTNTGSNHSCTKPSSSDAPAQARSTNSSAPCAPDPPSSSPPA